MPFGDWYGCFFCRTGQEIKLAETAQIRWPGLKARAVCAMKRRSSQGQRSMHPEVIMPGYIFFQAGERCAPVAPLPEGILKILTSVKGGHALMGDDAWFAKWLLDQDGVIGVSVAHRVDEKIRILQGPLKELQGSITRIDKRSRNAQVQLQVNGCRIQAWLPFEWLENAGGA